MPRDVTVNVNTSRRTLTPCGTLLTNSSFTSPSLDRLPQTTPDNSRNTVMTEVATNPGANAGADTGPSMDIEMDIDLGPLPEVTV